MRFLLLSVLVVCVIGIMIPSAFADTLQNKLDEYWFCVTETYSWKVWNNENCIKTDEKHKVGISPTEIADYLIEKDGTLTFTYEDDDISKKLEKFRDQTLHQELWDIYTSITPKQILSEVIYFVVYTDDYGEAEAASVDRDRDNPLKFDLFVDPVDMVPSGIKIDKQYYIATLIHENGHILSLDENQGDNNGIPVQESTSASEWTQFMTKGERSCANYYNDLTGCMNENSYLNAFFQKFWAEIYHDHNWEAEYDNFDNFYNHNTMFYKKYSSHFVTKYAASNPDEDFAESFMAFVLKEYPEKKIIPKHAVMKTFCTEHTISGMYCPVNGKLVYCTKTTERCTEKYVTAPERVPSFSIADQKILFFYNYPELVEMRDFIRSAIATSEFCDNESVWIDGKCQQMGGCLIATAAFGSEMAPQIQFLREIRDNTVLQTESGTSFMTGFNQFYYSFSPAIADYCQILD